jgi:exodeoxyribonuclease III
MRLISWNVNGIRSIEKKGFFEWMHEESPDILCLQETKAHPEQLTEKFLKPDNYHSYWASAEKKGYSGVAIYSKKEPKSIEGLGNPEFDSEGRTLLADFGDFMLFNIYYPNGGEGNKRVPFKMRFYADFLEKVETLRKAGKKIIITGDVNTAHTEIDLARPKENVKNTGFLPEEREWMCKFLDCGYVDTFRHFHKEPGHYSYWDYKSGARARNVGWRIDYFFVTQNLLPNLKKASILKDVVGSDHCPVEIEID